MSFTFGACKDENDDDDILAARPRRIVSDGLHLQARAFDTFGTETLVSTSTTEPSLSNPASMADRLRGVTFVDMLGNRRQVRRLTSPYARAGASEGCWGMTLSIQVKSGCCMTRYGALGSEIRVKESS